MGFYCVSLFVCLFQEAEEDICNAINGNLKPFDVDARHVKYKVNHDWFKKKKKDDK